jgi:hypothetical protein
MDVDIRYYSILPHYKHKKSFFRTFWKPTCDMLLREMGDFEVQLFFSSFVLPKLSLFEHSSASG